MDECYERKYGKNCLKAYFIEHEIWHLSEIDYHVRVEYEKYLRKHYVDGTVRSYLRGMDGAKQYLIRENAKTLKGKRNVEKHTDLIHDILFLPYHPNPVIAERYEYTTDISKLIWDFRAEGSDICKQQILTVLEDAMQQDIKLIKCTKHLNGLKIVYEFVCRNRLRYQIYYQKTDSTGFKTMQLRHTN